MVTERLDSNERLISLDQFRGYSVAAMFVVNFLGGLAVTHHVLKHNNTHFSYADSIMPSFIMICGLSYRMTFLKRLVNHDFGVTSRRFLLRSLGLISLSIMLYGFNSKFAAWSDWTWDKGLRFVAELFKANLWEVLAIIGACQILLIPLVATSYRIRFAAVIALGVLHAVLSWWFNFDFVYGRPNALDAILGTTGKRAWDGGLFGLISWSQIMIAGTLVFDLVHHQQPKKSTWKLISVGMLLLGLGYATSCLSKLYDTQGITEEERSLRSASPVMPDFSGMQDRAWTDLWMEPPFVPPPKPSDRIPNYWAMDKRVVSQSFVLFSTGFAIVLYGCFVWFCDARGGRLGVFQTFGQNPLAAYIIHHMVAHTWLDIVPKDSPLVWVVVGLVASFAITYLFVRFLENKKLYLRL